MEKIKQALQAAVDTYDRKGGVAPVLTRNTLQLFRAALSEMQRSKPKELTDDAPFKAFESEHYKGSFGVRGPHYSVAGFVNMSAAEAFADKMNWAFRLGRDGGYLSPQPKEPPRYVRSGPPVQMQDVLLACGDLNEQERVAVQWVLGKINELSEPPRYVMSKDYEQLAALLMEHDEVEVFATSNMPKAPTSRMAAMSWPISIIKNRAGVSLFGGTETVKMIWYDDVTAKKIVEVCTLLNLEWITVEPPKEQGAEPYAWTVSGTVCMYFGEDAESDARMEAKKIGGTAVAFPLFRQEQGAEPVDEERELADHYLYMGWLMARGDGPMTEDDVRDAFLHALKYARAHPSPTSREKAMEEAGEEVIKAYRGFHEAIEQHTGKPYPWDPMVSAIEKWTAAKSTK